MTGSGGQSVAEETYRDLDVALLQRALARGEQTVGAVSRAVFGLVDELDAAGPMLAAVVMLDPGVERLARDLDRRRRAGRIGGLLEGVPVLVKDNVDTAAPLPTTAGSLALSGESPRRDAEIVRRLRAAGALVVGKANLSEFGNFRALRSTRGWSAVRGLVRNPYALDRSAGGSSSGSAAAVAAGIVPAAIGTETDGSIVAPAELCGLVGLKPTVGLLPQDGIVPISRNQDSAGPIARTVRSVAILMDALTEQRCGEIPVRDRRFRSFAALCDDPGLTPLRVGVPDPGLWGSHPAARDCFHEAARALRDAGATVVDGVELPGLEELRAENYEFTVLLHDFKEDLDGYLRGRSHPGIGALEDIIEFNREHAEEELCHFGQELLELAAEVGPRTGRGYQDALAAARRCSRADGIDHALARDDLDCLLLPGFGPAWKSDLVLGDGPDLSHLASPVQLPSVAGYPVITVPVALVAGLPVGVALTAGAGGEGALIKTAYGLESTLDLELRPSFRPAAAG